MQKIDVGEVELSKTSFFFFFFLRFLKEGSFLDLHLNTNKRNHRPLLLLSSSSSHAYTYKHTKRKDAAQEVPKTIKNFTRK